MNSKESAKEVLETLSSYKNSLASGDQKILFYDLRPATGYPCLTFNNYLIYCDSIIVYIKSLSGIVFEWVSKDQKIHQENSGLKGIWIERHANQKCVVVIVDKNDNYIHIPSGDVFEFVMFVNSPTFTQLCLWDKTVSKKAYYNFAPKSSYGRYLAKIAWIYLKGLSNSELQTVLLTTEGEDENGEERKKEEV